MKALASLNHEGACVPDRLLAPLAANDRELELHRVQAGIGDAGIGDLLGLQIMKTGAAIGLADPGDLLRQSVRGRES
jgi:hypothetical protein